jgi:hypothetical protein
MHRRILLILLVVLSTGATFGCKPKPIACAAFEVKGGSRPSITSFDKAVNKREWSQCSDGKKRAVTCTPGHLSPWKCTCSIDGVDKIETRRDADFPDEKITATAIANETCHWTLEPR